MTFVYNVAQPLTDPSDLDLRANLFIPLDAANGKPSRPAQ